MDYQEITPIINLTMQSVKLLADEKHLAVSTALESNLPKVYMNGDSMERVLRNLLSNAIKYTPDNGRIRIKAELVDDGESIMVQVEDTGIGIPEEHLDYIWDRFYRVENEVHTIKGTGLGLHLVKVAIEQHHQGRVFAKSVLGKGSTIGFVIPVHHEINAGQPPMQAEEAPLV
jgi:two-component system sensor histidine kinase NblS